MNADAVTGWVAFLVGGLVITLLLSRLLWASVFRRLTGATRAAATFAGTLGIAIVLGGFGNADGGPPRFGYAFAQYLLPCLVWLAVDLWRVRKEKGVAPAA
jgi:hypothetical protein